MALQKKYNLPPPPNPDDDLNGYSWRDWFRQLRDYIIEKGSILWSQIDFTGSNITSIVSRRHNDLQSMQGGNFTLSEYYHLSNVDYTDLTDGGSTTLHYHASDRDLNNATGILSVSHGGTGQSSYTDGQLLIGNSTGNTLSKATLIAGTNVSITNGPGSITINASSDAERIKTTSTSTNAEYYLTFVDSNNSSIQYEDVYTAAGIHFNPNLNSLHLAGNLDFPRGSVINFSDTSSLNNLVSGDSSNNLVFWTAGSEKMRLNSYGNMGLGLTTPTSAIHVYRTDPAEVAIKLSNDTAEWLFGTAVNGSGMIYGPQNVPLIFSTANAEQMRLNATGLGIGVASPAYKLDVSGTVNATTFKGAGTDLTGTASSLSIGGNAATVTNGVYTTGSYSNPSWITSLDYSKLSGTVPTWNQNTTGNAATATSATTATNVSGGTASVTSLTYSTTFTGGTGIVNLGSGQFYKDSSGNLGINTIPNAWSGYKAIDMVYGASFATPTSYLAAEVLQNAYYNGTNWIYLNTGLGSTRYQQTNSTHNWFIAPSGTAGNAVSFSQAMTLDSNGNLGVGTSSPSTGTFNRQLTINSGASSLAGVVLQNNTTGTAYNDGSVFYTDGTNTTLLNYESGYILFGTNATERMRIDSSGNVGIGATPTNRFDVYKNYGGVGNVYCATIGGDDSGVSFTGVKIGYKNNNGLNDPGAYPFQVFSNGAAVFNVNGSGNAVVVASGAGLGYGTGSGGSVTQITSRTTGVTLNKTNGAITLVSAAGSTTYQTFTVTNSTVAATDTIIVNQKSGSNKYIILVTAVAAGSFAITFATTGGTTTEQPVFNFAVIKAVTS